MPFLLVFFAGAAVAGWICAADQSEKRSKEQQGFRDTLSELERQLAEKEAALATLRVLFGEKNEQVRILAAEIQRLRTEITAERARVA
ncbi:hypothetical protein KKC22_00445 [Myxococcota bacterium]|nr:hypothetical protein [Myxococcota bacterium]